MCDYSLEAINSVKAAKGDKLITTNFGNGTSGFRPADENEKVRANENTAVCLLPGTELAFDAPVEVRGWIGDPVTTIEHKVARFAKINASNPFAHHDGLEFPDRLGVEPVLLTRLVAGQTATVIQMPVEAETMGDKLLAAGVETLEQMAAWTGHEYID
jgi:hypothetical protein